LVLVLVLNLGEDTCIAARSCAISLSGVVGRGGTGLDSNVVVDIVAREWIRDGVIDKGQIYMYRRTITWGSILAHSLVPDRGHARDDQLNEAKYTSRMTLNEPETKVYQPLKFPRPALLSQ
jgi:hypothetical protein